MHVYLAHGCMNMLVVFLFAMLGHFGSLSMEFEMRNENVSITIMPLGLVYTERVLQNITTVDKDKVSGITVAVS